MKKNIVLILVAFLVMAQFVGIEKTNPHSNISKDLLTVTHAPGNIVSLLKGACYDCHSNETTYPWYTNIQPLGWWIKGHINGARRHLNFSKWSTYSEKRKKRKIKECGELIEEVEMPLTSYTWMHKDARLSDKERAILVKWFKGLL